jgi:hypothetical protein
VVQTDEGWGPVDFRSLGVREFGTIYEGLLENELSLAESDLATDKEGKYKPAKPKDTVVVAKGRAFLHNTSGQRKSTGSYFTKAFAVEHLLDHGLEPALKAHTERLNKLNDRQAAEAFFDFRVADITMGSAHFLVAAIDRIERVFLNYLANRPLPEVGDELGRLRLAARAALGAEGAQVTIEDGQLLRRQIARRCIYGVDLNPTAVNLARLAIWIHTFVPGLPLSFLDRTLVNLAACLRRCLRLAFELRRGWSGRSPRPSNRCALLPHESLPMWWSCRSRRALANRVPGRGWSALPQWICAGLDSAIRGWPREPRLLLSA